MVKKLPILPRSSLENFDEVFLFGSVLWSDTPGDVDILLVYSSDDLQAVSNALRIMRRDLECVLPNIAAHITCMSHHELESTQFLAQICALRIK